MDSGRDAPLETRLVRVRGRVQGVGYRYACVQQARDLGVTGWVRNRMDDSVEAMLQGTRRQLAQMCEWMREDVPAALVEDMDIVEVPPPFPTVRPVRAAADRVKPARHAAGATEAHWWRSPHQPPIAIDRQQVDIARALRAAGELDPVAAQVLAQAGERFLHARTVQIADLECCLR